MTVTDTHFTADWLRRRYSYAAVLGMAGVGAAFPAAAWTLLGPPLAVGMVVLGIAHGACDQLVVPASQPRSASPSGWRYWLLFMLGYLGLAGLVGVLWWNWPAATVGGFFVLTMWHWGSADMPVGSNLPPWLWLTHSLLRGLLLFAVPFWWWPTETTALVNGLLAFAGASTAASFAELATVSWMVVAVGHLLVWLYYAYQRHWLLLRTELADVTVLLMLLLALPPQLSVGVYFVFWHSLQHVLRLNGWLGYRPTTNDSRAKLDLLPQLAFFLRRAAPLLLLSCGALLFLGQLLAPRLSDGTAWFSLALLVASIVTLPHAVLVTLVMDAPRWHTLNDAE